MADTPTPIISHHFMTLIGYLSLHAGPSTQLPHVLGSLFFNGHASATGFVLIGVLVHHIRRILIPSLGQFLVHHPVTALKLAVSSPHHFLEDSLRLFDGRWYVAAWVLQAACVAVLHAAAGDLIERVLAEDVRLELAVKEIKGKEAVLGEKVGGLRGRLDGLLEVVVDGEGRVGEVREEMVQATKLLREAELELEARRRERRNLRLYKRHGRLQCMNPYQVALADICRVVHISCTLAAYEYAFAQAAWATAHIYAYTTTYLPYSSTALQKQYTTEALASNRLSALLQLALLAYWAYYRLWPAAKLTVVSVLQFRAGLPVFFALLWGVTAHVVRHSNYYFLALEMSDMLVTFGWAGVGVVFMGVCKFYDAGRRMQGLTEPPRCV